MDTKILVVLMLNFLISIVGTLAYSIRLVAIRTGKIAVSLSFFNIIMLISRIAVTFQVPILTNYVETNQELSSLNSIFYQIIIVSGVATIFGAFLIPTTQRLLYKAVQRFSVERSISRLLLHSFSKSGINYIKDCVTVPVKENVTRFNLKKLPHKILLLNIVTVAFVTVGALSPIYAGSIEPELRATCITLASIVNGVATILMSVFIDPQLSIMTDDVIDGKCTAEDFRACVIGMVGTKTIGTFSAILLVVPVSYLIVFIARAM